MAELPERKVLKQILAKLKAKTMQSTKLAHDSRKILWDGFIKNRKLINKQISEMVEDKEASYTLVLLGSMIDTIEVVVNSAITNYASALDDLNIYTESLEKYSVELDKTLNDIFEQATKEAEKQIEQQRKLLERKNNSYAR